jgi:hypothetical protein
LVQVVFAGREKGERGAGVLGKRERRQERVSGVAAGLVAQLSTREAGLYGVRFEQVFGARGREVAAYDLSLSYQGSAVAFFVAPDPRRFGKGSTLYFVSAGERSNPYGNEAVYELGSGEAGPSMAQATAYPSGASVSEALATREYETNRHYLSNLTTAPDPWLWEYLRTGERKSVVLSLSQLSASSAAGRIEIGLMGISDYPVTPDHHVRASLNGTFLGELSWDGKTAKTLVAEVPGGVLREGDNSLELENVGDTPASYSLVYLDRVSLSYPQRSGPRRALRRKLRVQWPGDGRGAGLGSGPHRHDLGNTGVAHGRDLEPERAKLPRRGGPPLPRGLFRRAARPRGPARIGEHASVEHESGRLHRARTARVPGRSRCAAESPRGAGS